MKKRVLFFILSFISISAMAGETISISRSPYALLMGDAFTARADDAYSVFYNPAAIGRNSGVDFKFINPDFGVTNALSDMDRFKNFPSSDPSAIVDRILGFPVYLHAGWTPTIKFGPFAITGIMNNTSSIVLRNATHPTMDINYRYDRGVAFTYAFSIGQGGRFNPAGAFAGFGKPVKPGKSSAGHRLSVGLTLKSINRQGIDQEFDVYGTALYGKIINSSSSSTSELLQSLGYSKGSGYGGDIGVEYALTSSNSELAWGLSVLDIGDTSFTKTQGTAPVPKQDMMINSGVSWRQDWMLFDYGLSADIRPINRGLSFGRMFHFGFEVGLPIVRVMAGWSEGYLSYGAKIRLWPIEISAGFYGVELGSTFKEEKGSRAVIYISLFDFSFDA